MSHTWKVAALDYAVSQDGLSNVVTTVHWTCSKEDENGNSGSAYGTHSLGSLHALYKKVESVLHFLGSQFL